MTIENRLRNRTMFSVLLKRPVMADTDTVTIKARSKSSPHKRCRHSQPYCIQRPKRK